MRTYTWDEYYEKFFDWAESTRVKNLTYLESLGDVDEVAEVLIELEGNKNAATRLLRKAVEEKIVFTGEALANLFLWDFDEKLVIEAMRNSAANFTTADIEALYSSVDEDILLEICQKWNIPVPKELREFDEDVFEETLEVKPKKWSRSELRKAYDCVLQCLYNAHEKMKLAYSLSICDVGSKKRSISIVKHACLLEAETFINEAKFTLEEIESQIGDKLSVQNTKLNLGKWIVFHDVWGDGFITDWMVQRRIRKMIQVVEAAYKEIQALRERL